VQTIIEKVFAESIGGS